MRTSSSQLSSIVSLFVCCFLLSSQIVVVAQKSNGRVTASQPATVQHVDQDKYSTVSPQIPDKRQGDEIEQPSERFEIPLGKPKGRSPRQLLSDEPGPRVLTAVDAGEEIEPNGTAATATPLGGSNTRIKGNIFPNGDVDFYSCAASAGDRVYAAVMTSFSASASVDSVLDVIAPDGTTVLETDLDDGSFGTTSSGIAALQFWPPEHTLLGSDIT